MAPGIGFGEYGDGHVRIALVENNASTAAGDPEYPGVPAERTATWRRRVWKTGLGMSSPLNVGVAGLGTVGAGCAAAAA